MSAKQIWVVATEAWFGGYYENQLQFFETKETAEAHVETLELHAVVESFDFSDPKWVVLTEDCYGGVDMKRGFALFKDHEEAEKHQQSLSLESCIVPWWGLGN